MSSGSTTLRGGKPRATKPRRAAAHATEGGLEPAGTRERLLNAVFVVVRRDGLSRLTAAALAAEAGIAQPRFYRYFDSLDACLAEAAQRMAVGFMNVTEALRRRMRDPKDLAELAAHYRAVFEMALEQRPFVELALRTAHEPTVLGNALRRVDADVRRTFADELFARGRRAGLPERDRDAVRHLADLILDSVNSSVARLVSMPAADAARAIPSLAEELALYTSAGTSALFERLLRRGARGPRGGS